MKTGQNISVSVELVSVTKFTRVNHHIPSKFGGFVENFVCVTMRQADGQLLVTMTKAETKFALDIEGLHAGDTFVVGCKIKEFRSDEEYGNRWAVTNCVLGGFKVSSEKVASNDRKAKRLAALGL